MKNLPYQNINQNNFTNQNFSPQIQMPTSQIDFQNGSLQNNLKHRNAPQYRNLAQNIVTQNNIKKNEYEIKIQNSKAQNAVPQFSNNQFSNPLVNKFPAKKNDIGEGLSNSGNIGGNSYGKISKIPIASPGSMNKYSLSNGPNKGINHIKNEDYYPPITEEDEKYFSNFLKNNKKPDILSMAPLLNLEHQNRHELEFMFIPNILPDLYSKGIINDDFIMNASLWKKFKICKKVSPIFLQKISVQKKILKSGVKKFIFIFPTPKCGCECFFAILYFDEFKNSNYFTLELEFGNDLGTTEGTGLVCGQKGYKHLNFYTICKVNLEYFENCVRKFYNEN